MTATLTAELPPALPSRGLAGQVALVTGASRGLGRVIAGALGDVDGAVEAFLGARAESYQRLGRMIAGSGGPGEDDAAVVAVMVHQLRQVAE